MLTLSGRIVAAAAAAFLVAGAVAPYPELVAVGMACLSALVTGRWWVLRRTEPVTSRTVTPPRVTEGEPARAILTLTNEGARRSPPRSRSRRSATGGWRSRCPACRPASPPLPEMSTATRRSLSNEARLRPPRLVPVTAGDPGDAWDRWRSADPSSWCWPSPGPSWPGSRPVGPGERFDPRELRDVRLDIDESLSSLVELKSQLSATTPDERRARRR